MTLTFKPVTPEGVRAVMAELAERPSDGRLYRFRDNSNPGPFEPELLFADYEMIRHPAYRDELRALANAGNAAAVTTMTDAEDLLALLSNSNWIVAARAAERFHRLSTFDPNGPTGYDDGLTTDKPIPWDDAYAPVLRDYLARHQPDRPAGIRGNDDRMRIWAAEKIGD